MSKECVSCCTLDVLSWRKDTRNVVKSSFPIQSLSGTEDQDQPSILARSNVSLMFTSADVVRQCPVCRPLLSHTFKIPDLWWAPYTRRSNGYFGYEDLVDDQGNRTAVITWVRFIVKRVSFDGAYYWAKLNAFSLFHISTLRTQIIVFDPHPIIAASPSKEHQQQQQEQQEQQEQQQEYHLKDGILITTLPRDSIVSSIFSSITNAELADPFWFYPRVIHDIVRIQDLAVWETTSFVRDVEKKRAFLEGFSTSKLQQIPRHVLHVFETLCVAEATLESIKLHHQQFLSTTSNPISSTTGSSQPSFASLNIRNRLNFHHHMLTSLRLRSSSSISRIATEVTLTYNEIAYKDAKLLRVDSIAMRAMAFVTLVFLPATFVSAIFGTGFFSYDAPTGIWGVSPKFWIFWAVAIPVTLMTMLGWLVWMKRFLHDPEGTSQLRDPLDTSLDTHWKVIRSIGTTRPIHIPSTHSI